VLKTLAQPAKLFQMLLDVWRHMGAQRPCVLREDIGIEHVIRLGATADVGSRRSPFLGKTELRRARWFVRERFRDPEQVVRFTESALVGGLRVKPAMQEA